MRGIVLTTAAVAAAICLAGCESGTLIDGRDGKVYKTVVIDGTTWMAENMNYRTDSSWCYNDSLSYCKKYGRLYTWDAAKKACPMGFRLSSEKEWWALVKYLGNWDEVGGMLKAKRGWKNDDGEDDNGTDEYGFSALPGGYRSSKGDFGAVGTYSRWWTTTEFWDNTAYHINMYNTLVEGVYSRSPKSAGAYVRCVQYIYK